MLWCFLPSSSATLLLFGSYQWALLPRSFPDAAGEGYTKAHVKLIDTTPSTATKVQCRSIVKGQILYTNHLIQPSSNTPRVGHTRMSATCESSNICVTHTSRKLACARTRQTWFLDGDVGSAAKSKSSQPPPAIANGSGSGTNDRLYEHQGSCAPTFLLTHLFPHAC
jgi:hypothetical protein